MTKTTPIKEIGVVFHNRRQGGKALRILIAPNAFKGTLRAREAAEAMAAGVGRALPQAEVVLCPLADGGDGMASALAGAAGGEMVPTRVTGPLGDQVTAEWARLPDGTAVIEMARASGLVLVPDEQRNPWITTTYGTGELIRSAIERGCRKLIVGIGGSATNDGGAGAVQALGVRLLDSGGCPIGFGGGALGALDRVDVSGLDPRVLKSGILVAYDVSNPLLGPAGASRSYGPQKGATPEMALALDRNLEHYAVIIKVQLGVWVGDLPGSGAAGGLGAGLLAFVGAKLRPGVDLVLEALGFDRLARGADLVITGEGRTDAGTGAGKAPFGAARLARSLGIPTLLVSGSLGCGHEELKAMCFDLAQGVAGPDGAALGESLADPAGKLAEATEAAVREWASRRLN